MYDFKVISSSEIFKSVVKYMDNGRARTPEVIIMEKNGVEFTIKFIFKFTYDWSHGMEIDKPIISIEKTNGKPPTSIEKKIIENYIEKNYKW